MKSIDKAPTETEDVRTCADRQERGAKIEPFHAEKSLNAAACVA
jgi:hypothetical protein